MTFCFDPICATPFCALGDEGATEGVFERLAESPDARARFLVEINLVRATGSLATLSESPIASLPFATLPDEDLLVLPGTTVLLGDGMWISKPTDISRPNAAADVRLASAGDIERTLPLQPSDSRRAQIVVGQIEIANGDGAYDDYVANYAPDGQIVRSWLGPARGEFRDFQPIWSSYGDGWQNDGKKVRLTLKDTQFLLDVPLQGAKYGGTGASDGDPELEGQLKPQLWGECFNVTPIRVNLDLLVYQVHDGEILSFDAVKENAVPFTFSGNDYPTFNALRGAPDPVPGTYHTSLAVGAFRLASEPTGLITCDARGDALNGVYVHHTGDILLRMAEKRALINASLIHRPSFSSLPQGAIGIYIDGAENPLISEVFDTLLQPINGWYGVLRDSLLRVGRIALPEETGPQRTFDETLMVDCERLDLPVPPRWKQGMAWGRNWTPMSEDQISLSLATDVRQRHALQYRGQVISQSSEVKLRHRSALDGGTMNSFFVEEAPTLEAAQHIMALFRETRQLFVATVKRIGYLLTLNQVIQLFYPRYKLEAGKQGTIIGMREVADKAEIELTVWT